MQNIELAHSVDLSIDGKVCEFIFMTDLCLLDKFQPFVEPTVALTVERSAHSATSVVTTDDDVFHAQLFNRVLKHGAEVEIIRRHHIRDVAMHKYLARHESRHLIRWHSAVSTPDPEIIGILLLR